MEKKNSKGLIILVVVLSILVVGLGGYIIYDKFLGDSTAEPTENNKTEQTEREVSQEEKDKILAIIDDINNYNLGKYDNLNPSELSNQDKLAFVSYIVYDNQLNGEEGSMDGLTGTQVSDIYKKYFGSSQSLNNADVYLTSEQVDVLFKYDSSKNIYSNVKGLYKTPAGYSISDAYSFINSATVEDDLYTVTVQTLYTTPCNDICGPGVIAGTYKDAANKTNALFVDEDKGWYDDEGNVIMTKVEEEYNEVKDKMPEYTYTFALEDGNYVLQNKTLENK